MAKAFDTKLEDGKRIRVYRRGSASQLEGMSYEERAVEIQKALDDRKGNKNLASIYRVIDDDKVMYGINYPVDDKNILRKIPDKVYSMGALHKATDKSIPKKIDLRKKRLDDLDWQKSVNITMIASS